MIIEKKNTMIVAKITEPFNQGMSVMVTGVTEAEGEIFQLTIWKVEPPYTPSDIQMGMKLFINNPKDITDNLVDSRSWEQWDLRKVAASKRRGHSILGGGVWQCQSADVDPSGRLHFEPCFSNVTLNRPGLFSGKVENIDSVVINFANGTSFEKKNITIAGTDNTVGGVFSIGGTYTDRIVVGDTVAFFAADYGFAPFLDSIPYVPVIEKTAQPPIARFKVRRQAVARFKGLVRTIVVLRRRRLCAAEAAYAPGGAGFDAAAARFGPAAARFGVAAVGCSNKF